MKRAFTGLNYVKAFDCAAAGLMLAALLALFGEVTLVRGDGPEYRPGNGLRAERVQRNGEIALAADLKLSGNRLVLEIDNNSASAGTILIAIALGPETAISNLGRTTIEVGPHQSLRFLLSNAVWSNADEASYILTIRDVTRPRGRLLLYQHARLRRTESSLPNTSLALTAETAARVAVNGTVGGRGGATAGASASQDPPAGYHENFTPPPDIQLQARLLAGPGEPPAAILALDLYAERARQRVEVEIGLGEYRSKRTIDIERQVNLSFNLPAGFESGGGDPVVHYRLRDRDRHIILEGDLALATLLGSEGAVVTDLQMDQPSYQPGAPARITLLLEGRPLAGISIELSLRDSQGQIFQSEQRQMAPESYDPAPSFTFIIPAAIRESVTIEYRVLDSRNGRLFDGGQREVPVQTDKQSLHW